MDEYTYSLRHDVRWNSRRDTLRLVRTTPDGCTTWISEGLTVAQWRAVLATLPAEDGDAPTEASIAAKLVYVMAERDELRKIVQEYEDARNRLVRRAVAAAATASKNARELRECAEAAERRWKELDAHVESAKELLVDPRTSEAADVADAQEGGADGR